MAPSSHTVAALSIGACFTNLRYPSASGRAGVLCSVIPDLDAIGFGFSIHSGDFWDTVDSRVRWFSPLSWRAHRLAIFRRGAAGIERFTLFGYLFLATVSHSVLDAMTEGGLGVAFSL